VQRQDNFGKTRKEKTARKGRPVRQLEQYSLNGTGRTRYKERTNRTGLPEQDCQHRTASTGLQK
jgi:hypothetical protein